MKDVPLFAGFIAGAATGLYVGLSLGYIAGRWNDRFNRWCQALESRHQSPTPPPQETDQ